jgi:hypothetical protein
MWSALAVTIALIGCAGIGYFIQAPVKPAIHPPVEVKTFHGVPDLPAWESLGKSQTVAAGGFFSDPADVHATKRTFHFPAKAIGSIGYGPDENNFLPARGEMSLTVPFSFVVGTNAGVLTGFRPDEIYELSMTGITVDDSMTLPIRNWHELKRLSLEWTDIGDQSIANLQKLPNLTRLYVAETHISALGLQQLHLEKLTVLDANHIMYAGQILPRLEHSKVIDVLKLANTGLKDSDLKYMAHMPSLSVLNISGNSITDRGIEILGQAKQLKYLWFSGNPVTAKCINTLKKLPHLSGVTLSMSGWSTADKAQFLKVANQMNCKVSDDKNASFSGIK